TAAAKPTTPTSPVRLRKDEGWWRLAPIWLVGIRGLVLPWLSPLFWVKNILAFALKFNGPLRIAGEETLSSSLDDFEPHLIACHRIKVREGVLVLIEGTAFEVVESLFNQLGRLFGSCLVKNLNESFQVFRMLSLQAAKAIALNN